MFFQVERRGQGACFCVYEGLSVRRGIWPDVVLIARELWMAFLRVWLTTPPQPGAGNLILHTRFLFLCIEMLKGVSLGLQLRNPALAMLI